MGVCQNQCITCDDENIKITSPRSPLPNNKHPELHIEECFTEEKKDKKQDRPTLEQYMRRAKTCKIRKVKKPKEIGVKIIQLRDVSPHFDAH